MSRKLKREIARNYLTLIGITRVNRKLALGRERAFNEAREKHKLTAKDVAAHVHPRRDRTVGDTRPRYLRRRRA